MSLTTFKKVKDNAQGTVVSGDLNNTTDPVTFDVGAGEGAKFPSTTQYWVTVWDEATYADPDDDPNMEILLVTSRSTDSLTADRGQLGTSAVAHTGTPACKLLFVSQLIDDITTAINSLEQGNRMWVPILPYEEFDYGAADTEDHGAMRATPNTSMTNCGWDNTNNRARWWVETDAQTNAKGGLSYHYMDHSNSSFDCMWDWNPTFYAQGSLEMPASGNGSLGWAMGGNQDENIKGVNQRLVGFELVCSSGTRTLYACHGTEFGNASSDISSFSDTYDQDSNAVVDRHAAAVKSGSTIKFYVNGSLAYTASGTIPSSRFDAAGVKMIAKTTEATVRGLSCREIGFSYDMW